MNNPSQKNNLDEVLEIRKLFTLLILSLFLVACSSANNDDQNNAEGNENNTENNQTAENENDVAPGPLESKILYAYDHDEPGEYDIQSIKIDAAGQTMTFTGKEDIDRETNYFTYFVDQNDNVVEGLDLAEDADQDRRCTDMSVSPNGDYLVYNCHDKDVAFSVYDIEAGKTIHQMEKPKEYIRNIFGISNDQVVYYEFENDDYETILVLYDAKSGTENHLILNDLFNTDADDMLSIEDPIQSDDGKYLLVNAFTELYLIDVENESAQEIFSAAKLADDYDDEIFIYNANLSPDAKYIYYRASENSSDPDYKEHVFYNVETDETVSYGEFEYSVRGFDVNGNAFLQSEEALFVHNIESEETRVVPEIEVGVYTGYFTFSHSGEYLIYTDKESNEDDTRTQNLIRVTLGDMSTYEEVELDAQLEKAEEKVEEGSMSLTEKEFDEADMMLDLWESSTNLMFPTAFPSDVDYVTNHYSSGISDDRRYSQTIYLTSDDEISFTAQTRNDRGVCVGFDDLDLVDTIDGREYYFYDYRNKDVAAAVATEDDCYEFEAEEFSEDEMLAIAKSLKTIDAPFHDLSLDALKFPTKFPIGDPEASSPRVISYKDGKTVDFLIDYRGDYDDDNDIKVEFEIRNNEPSLFSYADDDEAVDVNGFEEAYFIESQLKLFMYDGTYYYTINLDIDNDMVKSFGIDHIKDTFVEIANSVK